MKDIIHYLLNIEQKAERFYHKCAFFYQDNPPYHDFLHTLCQEEKWHYEILSDILVKHKNKLEEIPSSVKIDYSHKNSTNVFYFQKCFEMNENELTDELILNCIVDAEYSEWNDLFLYVIDQVSTIDAKIEPMRKEMQKHLLLIEEFFAQYQQSNLKLIKKFKAIKEVWNFTVLIADDDSVIQKLLQSILKKKYQVTVVDNGDQARTLIDSHDFDVIISDVEMKGMNGIDLCKNLEKKKPDLLNRLVFISGNPEYEDQLSNNIAAFISKPFHLGEILKVVRQIIMNQAK
ncbi:MAG: response regulator [Spirochaetes bacterium]|nr:response regulator [Spirochaetota bacterium]